MVNSSIVASSLLQHVNELRYSLTSRHKPRHEEKLTKKRSYYGAITVNGKPVYFLRFNGKRFGIFQRLYLKAAFEGTGPAGYRSALPIVMAGRIWLKMQEIRTQHDPLRFEVANRVVIL